MTARAAGDTPTRLGAAALLVALLGASMAAPTYAAERSKRAPRKPAAAAVAPSEATAAAAAEPTSGPPVVEPASQTVLPDAAPAKPNGETPRATAAIENPPAGAALPKPAPVSEPAAESPDAAGAASNSAVPADYRLGPEDVVDISVWRDDALKGSFLVRPDGYLSFPLAGEVRAEGRTAESVRGDITARLKKYFSDPVVSITVVRVAAQKIYVVGRVNKPGEYASGRYIDVLQALSMAGGFSTFAKLDDIRVMRKEGGKQTVIPFRYNDVIKGRNVEQNITLKPGDVVVVP